ncbi:protein translocase subunit SecF [Candidatus Falkowbacteria bacterium]|nr:protein translocase subunit SecF [Candidatus Falkowbacteria bacterium]
MKIIKYRNYYLAVSGILTLIAILLWIMWGLNLGIDFTGGSLLEIEYSQDRPSVSEVQSQLADLQLKGLRIQAAGEKGYILRFQDTGEEIHQEVMSKLKGEQTADSGLKIETTGAAKIDVVTDSASAQVIEKKFESIGPSIGTELKTKALYAIIFVVISIIAYIAISFRKVSYPVSSWKYGVAAVIALIHDIFMTVGIFVILGKFLNFEINTPFVAALLTILGYSVNDTIVVFDRIRENLHKYEGEFEEIVEKSIWETMARSINTIVTVELALLALLIFGGGVINDFVMPLLIGIFFGGYSSIFIASQAIVVWQKLDWVLKKSES